jgi:uncharacterized protein (DUF58 family)
MSDQRRWLEEGARAAARYALAIPRAAPIGQMGLALAHRAGSSLEFKEHRGYQPGDDLRHIDWNAYARSDQLTVKLYREEITPHLDLILDASRSMALEGSRKREAALALASLLATAATRAGYSHQAWILEGRLRQAPLGSGPPTSWGDIPFHHAGGPEQAHAPWRSRATRILISDLFWQAEPLRILRAFAERSASAVVVQLLARADVEPPEGQSVRLIDSEDGGYREIHVDASAARGYRQAFARHQQSWHDACRQCGATFSPLIAEDLLERWDLTPLVAAEVLRVA